MKKITALFCFLLVMNLGIFAQYDEQISESSSIEEILKYQDTAYQYFGEIPEPKLEIFNKALWKYTPSTEGFMKVLENAKLVSPKEYGRIFSHFNLASNIVKMDTADVFRITLKMDYKEFKAFLMSNLFLEWFESYSDDDTYKRDLWRWRKYGEPKSYIVKGKDLVKAKMLVRLLATSDEVSSQKALYLFNHFGISKDPRLLSLINDNLNTPNNLLELEFKEFIYSVESENYSKTVEKILVKGLTSETVYQSNRGEYPTSRITEMLIDNGKANLVTKAIKSDLVKSDKKKFHLFAKLFESVSHEINYENMDTSIWDRLSSDRFARILYEPTKKSPELIKEFFKFMDHGGISPVADYTTEIFDIYLNTLVKEKRFNQEIFQSFLDTYRDTGVSMSNSKKFNLLKKLKQQDMDLKKFKESKFMKEFRKNLYYRYKLSRVKTPCVEHYSVN